MKQFQSMEIIELQDIQGGSSLLDIPWVKKIITT